MDAAVRRRLGRDRQKRASAQRPGARAAIAGSPPHEAPCSSWNMCGVRCVRWLLGNKPGLAPLQLSWAKGCGGTPIATSASRRMPLARQVGFAIASTTCPRRSCVISETASARAFLCLKLRDYARIVTGSRPCRSSFSSKPTPFRTSARTLSRELLLRGGDYPILIRGIVQAGAEACCAVGRP